VAHLCSGVLHSTITNNPQDFHTNMKRFEHVIYFIRSTTKKITPTKTYIQDSKKITYIDGRFACIM
jgi:hypothetical protein